MRELLQDAWSSTLTNFRKYWEEFQHLRVIMREEHLPRFKDGTWDIREKENYPHLIRNLFTETFRAMPRTLSGIFILWLVWELVSWLS